MQSRHGHSCVKGDGSGASGRLSACGYGSETEAIGQAKTPLNSENVVILATAAGTVVQRSSPEAWDQVRQLFKKLL